MILHLYIKQMMMTWIIRHHFQSPWSLKRLSILLQSLQQHLVKMTGPLGLRLTQARKEVAFG